MGVDDGFRIIGSDPFGLPVDERDQVRRLRGRLTGPVTVWTAYESAEASIGITVSSVVIGEGEPPSVLGLIAPDSHFWEAMRASKRFVVHVLDETQTRIADQFALRYPGDPFEGLSVARSDYGPVLSEARTRARATLMGYIDAGYSLLIRGSIDEVELESNPSAPLVHYRGRYLTTRIRK